jgi:uncharacterized repeat protein (TIGR01451 family)
VVASIDPSATGSVSNTVTVSAASDTNPANDSATDTDTLTPQCDVGVTKSDGVTSVVPGTTTTYTIVVSNSASSPSTATNVQVSDLLPAGVTSLTWSGNGHSNVSGALRDTIASLAPGASVTYTVVAAIDASATGSLTNTVTVSAANDTNPANDSATDSDTLTPQCDVGVTKSDGVTSVVPGTTTTYTIVVSNGGPSTATNVAVSDPLPAGVTSFSWSGNGKANQPGALRDTIASLAPGASVTYTVVAAIDASATGSLTNTVTVSAANDTNPANNSASDTDTLARAAISGYVYSDNNWDGVFDAGDTGIAGIVLLLTGTDSQGNAVSLTATTDANGYYSFGNLPAGTYTVSQPFVGGGYTDGANNLGTVNGAANGTVTDNSLAQIVLAAGDQGINYDFGYFPPLG